MKKTGSIMDLKGCLAGPGRVISVEEMNQAVGDAIMEDWLRFERETQEDRLHEQSSDANHENCGI